MVGRLWHLVMKRMQGSEIRTRRLRLRELTQADARRIAEIGADWDIASMTSRMPYPYSEAAADQWINGIHDKEVVRGIALDGQLIGVTGYLPDEDGQSAEIGYWLGKSYWGQGYATEAAAALIAYCFRRERFSHVTCGHYIDNPASERVIAKLGFTPIGRNRCWCEARNAEVDALRYELKRPQTAWLRFQGPSRAA
ncbi:GCN5 family acetyltransferase [Candidatus Filomicrobium marinum]|uniref:GCN5 family acetyltransferase n=2 Tax=Filomicrobium TaxID=119044 RepID=A0A0D6JE29_9HYPH|nr:MULTISPECIES: GNAT family N-acetyltransferase [Filomicrobium]CFX14095.1 GCN5 family acetyltransferase [Candidatus Filomicrobium marinum]CPR17718.1 GCN5 family acetyltransferase [Candidatus Filomicrobium marinum]SDO29239.1 Protein N-acetyltransferase, RimJ/RimL family [Filomicrobium insigne]